MIAPNFNVLSVGISVIDKCMHLNHKIPLLVGEDLHCLLRPSILTDLLAYRSLAARRDVLQPFQES